MSMASDELADRVRELLPPRAAVTEKRMFGGICFMLNGNMLVCPLKDGSLMVRVGKDGMDEALELPGAEPMTMRAKTMTGFIVVSGDAIEDEERLAGWIERAKSFVSTLPAK